MRFIGGLVDFSPVNDLLSVTDLSITQIVGSEEGARCRVGRGNGLTESADEKTTGVLQGKIPTTTYTGM